MASQMQSAEALWCRSVGQLSLPQKACDLRSVGSTASGAPSEVASPPRSISPDFSGHSGESPKVFGHTFSGESSSNAPKGPPRSGSPLSAPPSSPPRLAENVGASLQPTHSGPPPAPAYPAPPVAAPGVPPVPAAPAAPPKPAALSIQEKWSGNDKGLFPDKQEKRDSLSTATPPPRGIPLWQDVEPAVPPPPPAHPPMLSSSPPSYPGAPSAPCVPASPPPPPPPATPPFEQWLDIEKGKGKLPVAFEKSDALSLPPPAPIGSKLLQEIEPAAPPPPPAHPPMLSSSPVLQPASPPIRPAALTTATAPPPSVPDVVLSVSPLPSPVGDKAMFLGSPGAPRMEVEAGSRVVAPPSDTSLQELSASLALLDLLRSGPPVPPLPPVGCYGEMRISSVISTGLGSNAAMVKEAANQHGDQPVKVLLPWCSTSSPWVGQFNPTAPAKVTISSALATAPGL